MSDKQEQVQITLSREQLSQWKLFIAVPCYDSTVTEPFMMSTLKTMMKFNALGLQTVLATVSDSLVTRARNTLVARFMAQTECTHMMFIDADIEYDPDSIMKLLWHNKDIIAAAYPIKEIVWKKVEERVKNGEGAAEAAKNSSRYAFSLIKPGQTTISMSNGAVAAYDLGTGFMLIKRETFQTMFEKYPELKYVDDTGALNEEEKKYTYALFDTLIDENGRYLSEDYAFCRYWQRLGGLTWLDPSIDLTHVGRYRYVGDAQKYADQFIQK